MNLKRRTLKNFLTVFLALMLLLSPALPLAKDVELLGAGALFPYPLYSKMFHEYRKLTGVKVNDQAIGSGGGIRQLMNMTVDFGGSDAFMSDGELARALAKILHIPICLHNIFVNDFTPYTLALLTVLALISWTAIRYAFGSNMDDLALAANKTFYQAWGILSNGICLEKHVHRRK